jgi:hypothetical protein
MAWAKLQAQNSGSALDPAPAIEIDLHFAVRATQEAPANDNQIVVPHPTVRGLHIVAWFPHADRGPHAGASKVDWPPQAAYRFKAVQLVANMVATAESEKFGDAIPRIIP